MSYISLYYNYLHYYSIFNRQTLGAMLLYLFIIIAWIISIFNNQAIGGFLNIIIM